MHQLPESSRCAASNSVDRNSRAPARALRAGALRAGALAAVLCVLGTGSVARADVRLPNLFGDNMVLQQGMAVPVWGWADEGETVTVQFRDQKVTTTAQHGQWSVKLRKLRAGGPDTLKVSGKNQSELQNVLVGEVWICSGQSNMEFPLNHSFESKADIEQSGNPTLRLFTVPKLKANEPTNNVNGSWKLAAPDTVPSFSAVAYYFGRDLQKALGVPIGLIHTSWGGSPAEVWMSQRVLAANPEYKTAILDPYPKELEKYRNALAEYEKEAADLAKEGKKPTHKKPNPPYWKPTELYNGMIAPLIPYAIEGAIWYQGESNAGRAQQYRTLFADMIRNWRHDWNEGNFTFLEVQLAPWDKGKKRSLEQITAAPGDSDWAELREAQSIATKVLPNVGMAVITDVGDKDDIHPTKKAPVGARLALAARGIADKEKIEYSGPIYRSMKVDGDKIILSFDHVGAGLTTQPPTGAAASATSAAHVEFSPDGKRLTTTDPNGAVRFWDTKSGEQIASLGALTGFAIAGDDKKFVWAKAEIQGETVVVSSPDVPHPVAVRYGWADYPVVNLWNRNGLLASPFRTDDFPMITAPKKELSTKL